MQSHRPALRIVAALAVIVCASAASWLGLRDRAIVRLDDVGEGGREDGGAVSIEENGYRFVYQFATGDECLYDLRTDPGLLRNLIRERPRRAAAMRRELERRLRLGSLDRLRGREVDTIRELRALGYM